MPRIEVLEGDCRDVLATLDSDSVHACITDPPYHLIQGGIRLRGMEWDGKGNRLTSEARGGFMGASWDGGDIAFQPDTWRAVWRVLKPGGYMVAFASARGYHRMVCAIEDAGFIIHPMLGWINGQGFPKATNLSKQIDKQRQDSPDWRRLGVFLRDRRQAARMSATDLCARIGAHGATNHGGAVSNWENGFSCPTWEQWQKLKTVLALPPDMDVEVWRLNGRKGKPGDAWDERAVIGVYDTDMGGLGGQRLGQSGGDITAPATPEAQQWDGWFYGLQSLKPALEPICLAQKPAIREGMVANVLAHGTGAINIDSCRVATLPGDYDHEQRDGTARHGAPEWRTTGGRAAPNTLGRWPANILHDGSDEVEAAFAGTSTQLSVGGSRGAGGQNGRYSPIAAQPDVKPGYLDQGTASRFYYCAKASKADRAGSKHPTVKPIKLLRWLVRLITPPGGKVLDCFAGTGTTGEAAYLEGFDSILIEKEPEYIADIRTRIAKHVPQKIIRAKIKPIIVRAKIKLPRAQIAMPIIVRARIQTAPNAVA